MLRSLLVEAGQSAARSVPELKRAYQRLKHRKHSGVGQGHGGAQIGGAAVLDVEDAAALCRRSHAGQPESSCGSG